MIRLSLCLPCLVCLSLCLPCLRVCLSACLSVHAVDVAVLWVTWRHYVAGKMFRYVDMQGKVRQS